MPIGRSRHLVLTFAKQLGSNQIPNFCGADLPPARLLDSVKSCVVLRVDCLGMS
jgi:hypothetical protein